MIKAQEYLDTNYPKKDRKEIKVLDISKELLEGKLVLEGFINLRELYCSNNKLTSLTLFNLTNLKELSCSWNELVSLNLNNTNNLEKIWCRDNNLTDLDFLRNLNHEALEELNILNNNFYEQDLSFLRKFINLKDLLISDNRFIGSLEPLRSMSKLKSLSIESTDIDNGLEYLPDSIQYFGCGDSKPGSKVKKFIRN